MRLLVLATLCASAAAFGGPRRAVRRRTAALAGETVRVKFRIYPDGRVEETVSGIKGSDCTKATSGAIFRGAFRSDVCSMA